MGIKDFFIKQREGWIFGFSDWILNNPKAFSILLFVGPLISFILFGGFTLVLWLFNAPMIVKLIMTLISIILGYKFVQSCISLKRAGSVDNMIGVSLNEMFYGGKDNGIGTTDVTENAENEYETVVGYNESDVGQVKRSSGSVKRVGPRFSDLIQESGSNSEKARD